MTAEAPARRRGRRRAGLELLLAVLVPAAIAGVLAGVVIPRDPTPPGVDESERTNPSELAAAAGGDQRALRPIVLRGERSRLGTAPAAADPAEPRPGEPARISIPAVEVDADVQPVGLTPTGIAVPAVGRAGWFRAGPRPGEPGRSVIIGHLDSRNGPGLFALLPGVENGTRITVTDRGGTAHRYRVVGKAQVERSKFPTGAVYGPARRPVLVLITCGGPWSPATGYRDNVLVYARAVS